MTPGPVGAETPWPLAASDRACLRDHQDARLRALASALETNRFYVAKLQEAGMTASDLRTCDSLARVPFTTKLELVADQAAHPPFGRLLTYPLTCYRYLHQTSGTSGRPLSWLDTDEDWATWMRCWHAVYRGANVGPGDRVFGAFSFGPYVSHWAAMAGARHAGALALAGGGLSSELRLRAIVAGHCTVLLSTPTYALHLAEVAAREGIDLRRSAVRVTIHAGEPGASVPAVRARIEAAWGARCFDHAGATEVGAWAFACQTRRDGLHLNELEFAFDVIDPVSLAPVPDGTRGELVVTTLGRHGMPVLRYRTGDLVERMSEPCACGLTLSCIRGGVLGRTDDMLIVRGVNVYPAAIDDLVRAIPEIVEYEVEIRRVEHMDDLLVKLEIEAGAAFADVERALAAAVRSALNIRVGTVEAPRGSLPRYELKARRYKRV